MTIKRAGTYFLKQAIREQTRGRGPKQGARYQDIVDDMMGQGYNLEETERLLGVLFERQEIYEPILGLIRLVE